LGENFVTTVATSKKVPLLDLKAQYAPIREEILGEITRVVDSQKFILGDEVQRFEQEVAEVIGARRAVGCASGSDALLLALLALDIQPDSVVVTTPYTFFATAGAISRANARPVFVDIDPSTYNINPELLRAALEKERRVHSVIPVHLFGAAADMDPISAAAKEHGAFVIEDAAQAIGGEYTGRALGTIGEVGCFSFFPSKNLGCFGDGGLVTSQSVALADKIASLRVHGRTGKYFHEWIGVNSRLDALQAAVLRVKLRYLNDWTEARRRNALTYIELLGGRNLPIALPQCAPYQTRHVYNQFVIRCKDRDRLRQYLQETGVGTEVYYPLPLHLQPCYKTLGFEEGAFPESERAARETLALPIYGELSREDLEYVAYKIQRFYS
jgi:dTDP-4-amino-4,6-dideoxygalactose transaminase